MAPALGYNRTEVTVAAPDQLAFTRTSNSLFTAAELFILANWLEAPNFPGCDLRQTPVSERLKHVHPQPPSRIQLVPAPR